MKPGSVVSAFRVQRVIAKSATSAVYEATQMSLRRTVALRLLTPDHFSDAGAAERFDERQRRAASMHHPNVVPLYEAGEWEGGRFVASRFIRGKTLASLIEEGEPPARGSLDSLRGALGAIHAAGLTHGRVSARNILVDSAGTPFLADLGAAEGGSPEEETRELDGILAKLPEQAPRRRWPAGVTGAAAVAAVVVGAVVLVGGGGSDEEDPAFRPFGCSEDPSANTPACTLVQTELDGRDLAMPRSGVIRSYEVRGASGGLALQVIREGKDGAYVVGFSQPESAGDSETQSFPANIGFRAGDRIGILLTPGGFIGAGPDAEGSTIVRWDGGLTPDTQAVNGTPLEGELLVETDVEYGAKPTDPGEITGAKAASAPEGEPVADISTPLGGGRVGQVVLVEASEGIALDVFSGDQRLARLEIPDADPAGDLIGLEENCGGATGRGFCLRWRNPDSELALVHVYQVLPSGEIKLIG